MEKTIKKICYVIYLLLLGRNIQLLSNGYSNKLTGVLLLANALSCIIFCLFIILKTKRYNVYVINLILGFSLFYTKYSGYRDLNKNFNRIVILVYMLSLIIQILIFLFFYHRKKKNTKILGLIILSVLIGMIFLEFLNKFYWEPKKIFYSTHITKIKDEEEMVEIIKRMPAVSSVYLSENEGESEKSYGEVSHYLSSLKEFTEKPDKIIVVSLKTSIDNDSLNLLTEKIIKYLKLVGAKKEKIMLYIVDDRDREIEIKVYKIESSHFEIKYEREYSVVADSVIEIIVVSVIKLLKGTI